VGLVANSCRLKLRYTRRVEPRSLLATFDYLVSLPLEVYSLAKDFTARLNNAPFTVSGRENHVH
jgi:hypothetical protein